MALPLKFPMRSRVNKSLLFLDMGGIFHTVSIRGSYLSLVTRSRAALRLLFDEARAFHKGLSDRHVAAARVVIQWTMHRQGFKNHVL